MHVQTTTPLDDRLHHRLRPSGGDRDAAGKFETLLCVLLVPEGDKEWYLYAARAGLPIGVASHRSYVSLTRSPVAKAPTNRPAPPPFSSIMARRRRWSAAKPGGHGTNLIVIPRSSSASGLPFPTRFRVFSRRCGAIFESPATAEPSCHNMNLILIPESGPGMLKDDQCIGTLNRAEAPHAWPISEPVLNLFKVLRGLFRARILERVRPAGGGTVMRILPLARTAAHRSVIASVPSAACKKGRAEAASEPGVADFRAGFEPFQGVARTFPGASLDRTGRAGRRLHGYADFAACQDWRPCMHHLRRSTRTRGVQRSQGGPPQRQSQYILPFQCNGLNRYTNA